MDEEELDEWYESEKERLTEEYQLKLKKAEDKQRELNRIKLLQEADLKKKTEEAKKTGKPIPEPVKKEEKKQDFHAMLKKDFLLKMKKLHKDYDEKSKNLVSNNLNKHFRKHRWKMFKNEKKTNDFNSYNNIHFNINFQHLFCSCQFPCNKSNNLRKWTSISRRNY